MTLLRLEVRDLRCIEHADLDLDSRLTVISGPNASGKTSLLEAVYFLSCGRSFRTHRLEPLIRRGAVEMLAVGWVEQREHELTLGAKASRAGTETRVGGKAARGFTELARRLPVQVIDPDVHKLLEEGPSRRRRYLDWGVFHVEHGYVATWRRYQRALKQRNAALRRQQPVGGVEVWERDLAAAGEVLTDLRSRYLGELQPIAARLVTRVLGVALSMELQQGWAAEVRLADALTQARSRDHRLGATTVGPHRADVQVLIDGRPVRDRISRGQQKLLAAALVLAQLEHRERAGYEPALLLLDDPAAELDPANLERLMEAIGELPAQLVVTALDPSGIEVLNPGRMFHVEQGRITPMV